VEGAVSDACARECRTRAAHRSKTYVNRLKIRLSFYFPEAYRRIVRNEAHVRLATSTWFVINAAKIFAWVGTAAAAVASAILAYETLQTAAVALAVAPAFLTCLFVCYGCHKGRSAIERFIHYQRLREVFYVLELAYTAFRKHPEYLASSPDLYSGRRIDDAVQTEEKLRASLPPPPPIPEDLVAVSGYIAVGDRTG
jgi:hypothetical protein